MRQAVMVALLIPVLASAQAPQKVPARFGYQGRLLDQSGAALNGTHQVTFSIYKQPTGGTVLWSETQKLALASGFYATFLGAVTPLPVDFDSAVFPAGTKVFDGSDLYLGVAVDGTDELTPRQQIGAVVYALRTAWAVRAKDADHADEATHAANSTSAGYATTAGSAGSATTAGSATSASYATTAANVSGGSVNATGVTTGTLSATSASIGSLPGRVSGGGGGFACSFSGFAWSGWGATCTAPCTCGGLACTMGQVNCQCSDSRARVRWLGYPYFLCVE